jgi:hypothetical protein
MMALLGFGMLATPVSNLAADELTHVINLGQKAANRAAEISRLDIAARTSALGEGSCEISARTRIEKTSACPTGMIGPTIEKHHIDATITVSVEALRNYQIGIEDEVYYDDGTRTLYPLDLNGNFGIVTEPDGTIMFYTLDSGVASLHTTKSASHGRHTFYFSLLNWDTGERLCSDNTEAFDIP